MNIYGKFFNCKSDMQVFMSNNIWTLELISLTARPGGYELMYYSSFELGS